MPYAEWCYVRGALRCCAVLRLRIWCVVCPNTPCRRSHPVCVTASHSGAWPCMSLTLSFSLCCAVIEEMLAKHGPSGLVSYTAALVASLGGLASVRRSMLNSASGQATYVPSAVLCSACAVLLCSYSALCVCVCGELTIIVW
jgi:hypothetical protein